MKVGEIMSKEVRSCTLADNLAGVVRSMWEGDCGFIPVVDGDPERRVVGVLTDRDICVALATRDRTAASLAAGDVVSKTVHTCAPEDDVKAALATMGRERIRRLPVVDAQQRLVGVLSMNDIVLRSEQGTARKAGPISCADVTETFKRICQRTTPVARKAAATASLPAARLPGGPTPTGRSTGAAQAGRAAT